MDKKNFKKWFTLFILILGGGTIYKLASIKDAFYIPMQEQFGLSHTQIGMAMGLYGTIGTFGYFISIYISDRFSKKKLIPLGLIGTGCVGLYFSTFPGYNGLLVTFALLAVFDTVIYWPVLLKAVRLLGTKNEQGRMFGFLEAGRGVIDTIVAFSALGIFILLGKSANGLRGAIYLYSIAPIVIGIISYFLLDDDIAPEATGKNKNASKNKVALAGVIKALKMPEIWIVSLNIFSVYSIYIGLTYFIPFLKNIYGLPVALVGAYGIVNQYGLKMIGGPLGGLISDKKFKSASKFLRAAFAVAAVVMTVIIFLPHESMNVYSGMSITLGFGAIVFAMRAVFFVPIEEVQVPRDISGAAMSIASFIGYAPYMFMYTYYGSILDKNPGMGGYQKIFATMIAFSLLGIIISSILVKVVKKKENIEPVMEKSS